MESSPPLQSEADHNATKARDRASIDSLLNQPDQKEASEALLSPKQTTVTFDTYGAPPNSSTAAASQFPTPNRPAQRTAPRLQIKTAPATLAPSTTTPGPTVRESNAALQTAPKVMRRKSTAVGAAKLATPQAGKPKAKTRKTPDTTTNKQLDEALVCNANLQRMLENFMDTQEALEAKLARRKPSHKKSKKPHYYAVACGWQLGIFKVPTDLEEYQKTTIGFPKGKLRSKKFPTRKAVNRWLEEELADSDASRSSDEENSSNSDDESPTPPRKNRKQIARECPNNR
jgi:hypothetical protein